MSYKLLPYHIDSKAVKKVVFPRTHHITFSHNVQMAHLRHIWWTSSTTLHQSLNTNTLMLKRQRTNSAGIIIM